jgi:large subunit ribosomal protein L6
MSRVGKRAVEVPSGVSVEQSGRELQVKGPKGSLAERMPASIDVRVEGGEVRLARTDERQPTRAAHGLARALVANMVRGVTEGFARELEIQGVGYRAEASGQTLKLSLGFSHPISVTVPAGLKVSVRENRIRVEGADKRLVGQFVADVRGIRPPEPYKGKGIRYVDEQVRRKVGKAGTAA